MGFKVRRTRMPNKTIEGLDLKYPVVTPEKEIEIENAKKALGEPGDKT